MKLWLLADTEQKKQINQQSKPYSWKSRMRGEQPSEFARAAWRGVSPHRSVAFPGHPAESSVLQLAMSPYAAATWRAVMPSARRQSHATPHLMRRESSPLRRQRVGATAAERGDMSDRRFVVATVVVCNLCRKLRGRALPVTIAPRQPLPNHNHAKSMGKQQPFLFLWSASVATFMVPSPPKSTHNP